MLVPICLCCVQCQEVRGLHFDNKSTHDAYIWTLGTWMPNQKLFTACLKNTGSRHCKELHFFFYRCVPLSIYYH